VSWLERFLRTLLGWPMNEPKPAALPLPLPKNRREWAGWLLDAMSRVDMRGIPKDIPLSKFGIETGYGTGDIWRNTRNPGSIKSTVGWTGKPSYKDTRVYATIEDGIRDWVRLMSESPRYRAAYAAMKARDFRGSFRELEVAGYEVALNPPYSVRLENAYALVKREGLA
jgi:uncharacterized FlgJ-related protein